MPDSGTKGKSESENAIRGNALVNWILNHDSSLIFNILYIGLAIILSIWLGLFWLIAVVFIHAAIEIFRQHLLSGSFRYAILETLWEIKLDITLIIFAFWLGIYLDFIFGVAGLSAASRATVQTTGQITRTGTRFAGWQRFIRGFFIAVDDVGLAAKAFTRKGKGKKGADGTDDSESGQEASLRTSWSKVYSSGDKAVLITALFFLLLIVLAPVITDKSLADTLLIIRHELKPF